MNATTKSLRDTKSRCGNLGSVFAETTYVSLQNACHVFDPRKRRKFNASWDDGFFVGAEALAIGVMVGS
jgi:hypothetical protein